MNSYKIGDEVRVCFIGQIVEMKKLGDKVVYTLDGSELLRAYQVYEDVMTPLELPKELS